jgi:hypothetical protein
MDEQKPSYGIDWKVLAIIAAFAVIGVLLWFIIPRVNS